MQCVVRRQTKNDHTLMWNIKKHSRRIINSQRSKKIPKVIELVFNKKACHEGVGVESELRRVSEKMVEGSTFSGGRNGARLHYS